jgi:hypothetical protein
MPRPSKKPPMIVKNIDLDIRSVELRLEMDGGELVSLLVNGRHIWRFDNLSQGCSVMGNLEKALEGQ